jgi:fructose-1,6-bisphosphatase II
MACTDGTGVDLLLGIGGTPEGIIAACAVKCLGGTIQASCGRRRERVRQRRAGRARPRGGPVDRRPRPQRQRLLRRDRHHRRRARARACATAAGGATTESLVMRSKSGTIRRVSSQHRLSKLRAYSAIDFDHHERAR